MIVGSTLKAKYGAGLRDHRRRRALARHRHRRLHEVAEHEARALLLEAEQAGDQVAHLLEDRAPDLGLEHHHAEERLQAEARGHEAPVDPLAVVRHEPGR
ncbi:MAG: hypothetical protein U5L05_17965 [Rubrivivax sp.]|nr:hypothetical protein [Rubrivivax sp.]